MTKQLKAVYDIMKDGYWRTLPQIQQRIPEATTQSISARLRDLRKKQFGGFLVERKRLANKGNFAYRLDVERSNDFQPTIQLTHNEAKLLCAFFKGQVPTINLIGLQTKLENFVAEA